MNLCCLKCTSILDRVVVEDIELDHCPSCGGLWLDAGEIEQLSRGKSEEISRLRGLLLRRGGPPPVPSAIQSTCPACTGAMKELELGPIHVDVCTKCGGLFLDRGELDGALAAVKDDAATVGLLIATAAVEASVG